MLITDQNLLDDICNKLENYDSIGLDTEFVRKETYYPKLSIVQISTKDGSTYIIDSLYVDISIFNEKILQNPNILKIIHAPQQDFEIFYHIFKQLPINFFDTQTAAKFCGFRAHMSYAELCKSICDAHIDKTYQAHNWLKRPLPPEMLEYARTDVKYLHQIYDKLKESIRDLDLFHADTAKIIDEENYNGKAANAWKKVKARRNSIKNASHLKILAAFREDLSAQLDIPRSFLISDESLVQICKNLPTTKSELRIQKQKTKWITLDKYQQKLFDLCAGLREESQ